MEKVLVTGANGFIGRQLCRALIDSGFGLRAAIRKNGNRLPVDYDIIEIDDIDSQTDWQKALVDVDVVIHLAGLAHMFYDVGCHWLSAFRKVNVLGTERLSRMAAKAGVKRFIFISSVKVNGEGVRVSSACGLRMTGGAYTEKDIPAPQDAYGVSKLEAENILKKIADESGLQIVILRLPLVYGPGVKANFKSLIKLASSGLPLPFKSVNNRRSFLYLGNLVDAMITCISHPLAAGETFLVSDGQDVSTPDLIKMIACAMKKKAILFYLHPGILRVLCKITGKTEELEKLTGSLLVDSSKIRSLLGWKAPFTLEEGIRETVNTMQS